MRRLSSIFTALRPQGPRATISFPFGPEWLAVGALALLDLLLAPHANFHVAWHWRDTTLALAFIYAFRRTGPIGAAIIAVNSLMLLGTAFIGGHYLIDMIAGAAIALACIAAVEGAPSLAKAIMGDGAKPACRPAPAD